MKLSEAMRREYERWLAEPTIPPRRALLLKWIEHVKHLEATQGTDHLVTSADLQREVDMPIVLHRPANQEDVEHVVRVLKERTTNRDSFDVLSVENLGLPDQPSTFDVPKTNPVWTSTTQLDEKEKE